MRINLRAKLNLFDLGGMLMLLGFLLALGLLVAELAEVHYPADGRRGVGGDLDQVQPVGARQGERIPEAENPELSAIRPDHPDLTGANLPVNPDERSGRRRITRGKRETQDTLLGWLLFMQVLSEPYKNLDRYK